MMFALLELELRNSTMKKNRKEKPFSLGKKPSLKAYNGAQATSRLVNPWEKETKDSWNKGLD